MRVGVVRSPRWPSRWCQAWFPAGRKQIIIAGAMRAARLPSRVRKGYAEPFAEMLDNHYSVPTLSTRYPARTRSVSSGAMEPITVREARRGDEEALARIRAEVARYYLDLAPDYFQVLERFAEPLGSEAAAIDSATLHLVAEAEGQVVGARRRAAAAARGRSETGNHAGAWSDESADRVSRRSGGKPKTRRRCPPCRGGGGVGASCWRDDRRNDDLPRKPALGLVLGGTHELRGTVGEPA